MPATLYLLPNRISETAPADTLPAATLAAACRCRRFLAENAKSARAFLKTIGHPGPIADLEIIEIGHAPDPAQFQVWLAPVLAGADTALVSESGCPAVADPGAGIVALAHRLGIAVKPLVGPSSILLTLMASGLNGQRFRFLGYLPIEENELEGALRTLEAESRRRNETQLFIETPYRNRRMLSILARVLAGSTMLTVATDVTGAQESIATRPAGQWAAHVEELPKLPTVFAFCASGPVKQTAREGRTAKAGKAGPSKVAGSARPPRHHPPQAPGLHAGHGPAQKRAGGRS